MTMKWTTQELPIIATNDDLTNSLALYEQLVNKDSIDGTDQQFLYLLGLIIADYEAEHYPIAETSTVDFIDYLLETRSLQWTDICTALGYHRSISVPFLKTTLSAGNQRACDLVKLSHFFKLPMQAFIVGGYNA